MLLVNILTGQLLVEVIDPKGHDGQPIHCATGRLRVQLSPVDALYRLLFEVGGDPIVDFLDPIISCLIEPVDVPLDFGNLSIGHIAASSDILFVPKKIVELVLLTYGCKKGRNHPVLCIGIVDRFTVPSGNAIDLHLNNIVDAQHGGAIIYSK